MLSYSSYIFCLQQLMAQDSLSQGSWLVIGTLYRTPQGVFTFMFSAIRSWTVRNSLYQGVSQRKTTVVPCWEPQCWVGEIRWLFPFTSLLLQEESLLMISDLPDTESRQKPHRKFKCPMLKEDLGYSGLGKFMDFALV